RAYFTGFAGAIWLASSRLLCRLRQIYLSGFARPIWLASPDLLGWLRRIYLAGFAGALPDLLNVAATELSWAAPFFGLSALGFRISLFECF
ncbi:MAG: hypothetical protein SH859_06090, partial [Hyphomicrobium aestuarii]|nr:hypothetical protein [Hyphomicrobium aestuarii]